MKNAVSEKRASNTVAMIRGGKHPIRKLGTTIYSQYDTNQRSFWRWLKMREETAKKSEREGYESIVEEDRFSSASADSCRGNADFLEDMTRNVGRLWLMISLV